MRRRRSPHRGSWPPAGDGSGRARLPRPPADPGLPPLECTRDGPAPPRGECTIFYKDQHLLMVDKAPGLLTVPPDQGNPPTVMGQLRHRLRGAHEQVFAVHRLDRDTSGVLVVARTRRALDALVDDLAARAFERVYLALVQGTPPPAGTVRGSLGTVGKDIRMRALRDGEGQEAVTHFRVVEQANGMALVAFKLETGRRNQIRVQVAELGHPLVGESQYAEEAERSSMGRQALHSHRLSLRHPVTGRTIRALSPLPEDMLRTWHAAGGRHGPVLRSGFEIPGPGAVTFVLEGDGRVSAGAAAESSSNASTTQATRATTPPDRPRDHERRGHDHRSSTGPRSGERGRAPGATGRAPRDDGRRPSGGNGSVPRSPRDGSRGPRRGPRR